MPVLERTGYQTGIDLYALLDAADFAGRELMPAPPVTDSISIVSGLAGVFSGFKHQVLDESRRAGVDPRDVFFELGRRQAIAGQEDLIIDVAAELSGRKAAGEPAPPGPAPSGPVLIGPVLIGASEMAGDGALELVMDALADAFADLSAGRTRSPSRTVIEHGGGRQLVVGPAVWARRGVASVKITTLTPGNPGRGLPLIHGVVVLTDTRTGQVTALLEGGELTAVRTGAVAGLATRLCAAPDAADLAVIGAGVQARALLRAMLAVRPIRSVRVFSRTPAHAETFAGWVREAAGRPARAARLRAARLRGARSGSRCAARRGLPWPRRRSSARRRPPVTGRRCWRPTGWQRARTST